jgi:hypothetical protein
MDEARAWCELLRRQYRSILASGCGDRPWMYWELHNPWSRAATCVDSWALLDLCQSPALLEEIAQRIGEDIVLFDSQILANPCLDDSRTDAWRNDTLFFPMEDPAGLVVRIPFGGSPAPFEYRGLHSGTLQRRPGTVLMHGPAVRYRADPRELSGYREYVIRYFRADRHFERDPGDPRQLRLTERFPWVNYARMPHWLVRGEDRAGNDFVTGFHTRTGRWTAARAADPFMG